MFQMRVRFVISSQSFPIFFFPVSMHLFAKRRCCDNNCKRFPQASVRKVCQQIKQRDRQNSQKFVFKN